MSLGAGYDGLGPDGRHRLDGPGGFGDGERDGPEHGRLLALS